MGEAGSTLVQFFRYGIVGGQIPTIARTRFPRSGGAARDSGGEPGSGLLSRCSMASSPPKKVVGNSRDTQA
jgi:hypothetical protein